jgi:hypothetical protein
MPAATGFLPQDRLSTNPYGFTGGVAPPAMTMPGQAPSQGAFGDMLRRKLRYRADQGGQDLLGGYPKGGGPLAPPAQTTPGSYYKPSEAGKEYGRLRFGGGL